MIRNVLYAALPTALVSHRQGWKRGLLFFTLFVVLFFCMDRLRSYIRLRSAQLREQGAAELNAGKEKTI